MNLTKSIVGDNKKIAEAYGTAAGRYDYMQAYEEAMFPKVTDRMRMEEEVLRRNPGVYDSRRFGYGRLPINSYPGNIQVGARDIEYPLGATKRTYYSKFDRDDVTHGGRSYRARQIHAKGPIAVKRYNDAYINSWNRTGDDITAATGMGRSKVANAGLLGITIGDEAKSLKYRTDPRFELRSERLNATLPRETGVRTNPAADKKFYRSNPSRILRRILTRGRA